MALVFATEAEILRKAGAGASSTSSATAYVTDFEEQAQSVINAQSQYNWSDAYSALNADVQGLLKEAASNLAATYVIIYDMSGYLSLAEVQTRLDVLDNNFNRAMALLKDVDVSQFVQNA